MFLQLPSHTANTSACCQTVFSLAPSLVAIETALIMRSIIHAHNTTRCDLQRQRDEARAVQTHQLRF